MGCFFFFLSLLLLVSLPVLTGHEWKQEVAQVSLRPPRLGQPLPHSTSPGPFSSPQLHPLGHGREKEAGWQNFLPPSPVS